MNEVEVIAFRAQRVLHNEDVMRYMGFLKDEFGKPGVVRRTVKAHEGAYFLSEEISKKQPFVEHSQKAK